jgi:hypothetical protein
MLGIPDPWVFAGYLLTSLSAILCIVHGLVFWDKEEELSSATATREWERDEIKIEETEEGL